MEDHKKTQLFETMPIPRAVFKLAVPTVLASLVIVFYNLADTFFVGELNDAVQNAGVTLAAPVLLAFNAVTNLFGIGTSSKMSRAMGAKDFETVYRASSFGFYCALICSIVFSVLCAVFKTPLLNLLGADSVTWKATGDYLRWTVIFGAVPAIMNVILSNLVKSEGSAMHASIGTMSGCLLNIALDPIFILPWGLGMGAAGAGLATFISNCVALGYFFVFLYVKRGKTYVCIDPRMAGFRKGAAGDIFFVGIPASIQNILNVTGMTLLNNFTAAYNSAAAVAAMGISHKIAMVPMFISLGLGQSIMPLISYNYSSGNPKRMKESFMFTTKISLILIVVMSAALCVFSGQITGAFLADSEVVAYGTQFLRAMGYGLPFLCVDFIGVSVFQACGMGRESLLFAIARKIVLEIPALIVLNRLFPLYGLAWAQSTAEFILSIVAVVVLARLFRRLERTYETQGGNLDAKR